MPQADNDALVSIDAEIAIAAGVLQTTSGSVNCAMLAVSSTDFSGSRSHTLWPLRRLTDDMIEELTDLASNIGIAYPVCNVSSDAYDAFIADENSKLSCKQDVNWIPTAISAGSGVAAIVSCSATVTLITVAPPLGAIAAGTCVTTIAGMLTSGSYGIANNYFIIRKWRRALECGCIELEYNPSITLEELKDACGSDECSFSIP